MQELTISASQIGPLGMALGAQPDAGGSDAPAELQLIPIVDRRRFDERQTCHLVHDYLSAHGYAEPDAQADVTDRPTYRSCSSYRAGLCRGTALDFCLFVEEPGSEGWQRALRWRRLPSGTLCPAEDYQAYLDHERTWQRSAHTDRHDAR